MEKHCREIKMFNIKWLNIQKPGDCHGQTLIEVNKIAKLILVILFCFLFGENVRGRFLDLNFTILGKNGFKRAKFYV